MLMFLADDADGAYGADKVDIACRLRAEAGRVFFFIQINEKRVVGAGGGHRSMFVYHIFNLYTNVLTRL